MQDDSDADQNQLRVLYEGSKVCASGPVARAKQGLEPSVPLPQTKPPTKSATKPTTKPVTKPATKQQAKQSEKPQVKSADEPSVLLQSTTKSTKLPAIKKKPDVVPSTRTLRPRKPRDM